MTVGASSEADLNEPSHRRVTSGLDILMTGSTRGHVALLATSESVSTAAVFVHGFGGKPDTTWTDFAGLIEGDPQWQGCDVYFLAYPSVTSELTLSAGYIRKFLERILPEPPDGLLSVRLDGRDHRIRTNPGCYERLILVGHSEGGVVLRALVRDALKQHVAEARLGGPPSAAASALGQICLSDLRLFAPALTGARIAGRWGIIAAAAGLRQAISLLRRRSPAMQELKPGGLLLQGLRDDTTYFAQEHAHFTGLRAQIAWAHHDKVVTSLGYRHDTECRIRGRTHLNNCKPDAGYRIPIELVMDGRVSDRGELI